MSATEHRRPSTGRACRRRPNANPLKELCRDRVPREPHAQPGSRSTTWFSEQSPPAAGRWVIRWISVPCTCGPSWTSTDTGSRSSTSTSQERRAGNRITKAAAEAGCQRGEDLQRSCPPRPPTGRRRDQFSQARAMRVRRTMLVPDCLTWCSRLRRPRAAGRAELLWPASAGQSSGRSTSTRASAGSRSW